MVSLIEDIGEIEIQGTKDEQRQFKHELKGILSRMEREDKELHDILVKIQQHNTEENPHQTWKHSLSVASICNWLAKRMGMHAEKRKAFTIWALFHDTGRITIPALILESSAKEQWAAYDRTGKERPANITNPALCVTPEQLLIYLSMQPRKEKAARMVLNQMKSDKELRIYLKRALIEFLRAHQKKSHEILKKTSLRPKEVRILAFHHPEYLQKNAIKKLPKECMILSIADKWAAMRQTEGRRAYIEPLSKMRSLSAIANHILNTIPPILMYKRHHYAKSALRLLVEHHFNEAMKEVEALASSALHNPYDEVARADALIEVTAALHICKEFNGIASHQVIEILQDYQEKLSHTARWKQAA